jgi:hypothetical protein
MKNNMSKDDDVVDCEIETLIAFVIGGVSKENTSGGPGCQFVSSFGREIGIAGAIEHAQVLIGGGDSMLDQVWTGCADRLGGKMVQHICGGVEPFYSVASWNRNMKEQGA